MRKSYTKSIKLGKLYYSSKIWFMYIYKYILMKNEQMLSNSNPDPKFGLKSKIGTSFLNHWFSNSSVRILLHYYLK